MQRTTIAPAFKKGFALGSSKATPLVLMLQHSHYRWLKPPSNVAVDPAWLKESAIPSRGSLSGAAKRKYEENGSNSIPSVHTLVQASVAQSHAPRSIAQMTSHLSDAPSVHTMIGRQVGADLNGSQQTDTTEVGDDSAFSLARLLTMMNSAVKTLEANGKLTGEGTMWHKCMLTCNTLARILNARIEDMDKPEHGTEIDATIPTNGDLSKQASYTQRRLHRKTSWRGSFNLETKRWSCSLCDFQGEVQVKNQIGHVRHQHMRTCHPKDLQITIGQTSHSPATKKVIVFEKNLWTCNL